MRLSTILASTLAVAVSAAPTFPEFNLKEALNPDDTLSSLSDYFNLLATRVQLAKVQSKPPTCDVTQARMPQAPVPLPAPSEGHKVKHVAVGRGTQNYTCEANNKDAKPEAAGALAYLYDASCIAALYPDLLERIPAMALRFNLSDATQLGASPLSPTGIHYFSGPKTAYFKLADGKGHDKGEAYCAKESASDAPLTAAVGQKDEKAVPWLMLKTHEPTTGKIQEVYRVDTAGGSPPATCEGMSETFEVEYASVYWFWEGDVETAKKDGADK